MNKRESFYYPDLGLRNKIKIMDRLRKRPGGAMLNQTEGCENELEIL